MLVYQQPSERIKTKQRNETNEPTAFGSSRRAQNLKKKKKLVVNHNQAKE